MTETNQQRVHLDYETFSEADITEVGGATYAAHPSTKILMAAWCIGDGEVSQWDALTDPEMPQELRDILENRDGSYKVYAQNANFEILISLLCAKYTHDLDLPDHDDFAAVSQWLSHWHCTMVMGMGASLPGKLSDQNAILKVGDQDAKEASLGKRLIRKFCMPNRKTKANPSGLWDNENAPEDYAKFLYYNRQDVVAERANYRKLIRYNTMPPREWRMWRLDQIINLWGMTIDQSLVQSALKVDADIKDQLMSRFCEVTGLENPNSTKQFLPWLNERGYAADNVRKDTVNKALKSEFLDDEVKLALKLRQSTSKNSIKKFVALSKAAPKGKLRGTFQYAGAQRTRRWGGRIFQPQNLPRGIFKTVEQMRNAIDIIKSGDADFVSLMYGVDRVPDVLSSVIRNAVTASGEGRTLTVGDLSSIETIMTWWAAGATSQLEKVARGIDAYKDYGTQLLGVPYDEITKEQRTYCKPVVLGCTYRLGGTGLVAYADGMGVKMTKEEAYNAVDVYRAANPEVVELWDKLQNAFMATLQDGRPRTVNGKFRFRLQKPCMIIDLPAGRSLYYVSPRIQDVKLRYEDRETGLPVEKWVTGITYMGIDQNTRKWVRQNTHGGKLTENIVQAIARDILADAMLNLSERDGYGEDFWVVGHVHDEIITDTPDEPEYIDLLTDALTNSSPWCADAPLGAEAFQNFFYMKD